MLKLEERRKVRAHMRAVNGGEIVDRVITHGTDNDGNVIGDDGSAVEGTAPKGQTQEPANYAKFGTHADLDAQLTLLNVDAPDGWAVLKVAEKQAKLAEIAAAGSGW